MQKNRICQQRMGARPPQARNLALRSSGARFGAGEISARLCSATPSVIQSARKGALARVRPTTRSGGLELEPGLLPPIGIDWRLAHDTALRPLVHAVEVQEFILLGGEVL